MESLYYYLQESTLTTKLVILLVLAFSASSSWCYSIWLSFHCEGRTNSRFECTTLGLWHIGSGGLENHLKLRFSMYDPEGYSSTSWSLTLWNAFVFSEWIIWIFFLNSCLFLREKKIWYLSNCWYKLKFLSFTHVLKPSV